MAKMSKELLDQLCEFLIHEIGSKSIDGITYTMLLKDKIKDKENDRLYSKIKEVALQCGFSNEEILRRYEVANGYIYDMDLPTAKQITIKLSETVYKDEETMRAVIELVNSRPEKRRDKDMQSFAKFIIESFYDNKEEVELALFSKNASNTIMITGKGPSGESLAVKYNAYALRHTDIEKINSDLLIPNGIRVSTVRPYEILPSKTGVRFVLGIEKVN